MVCGRRKITVVKPFGIHVKGDIIQESDLLAAATQACEVYGKGSIRDADKINAMLKAGVIRTEGIPNPPGFRF